MRKRYTALLIGLLAYASSFAGFAQGPTFGNMPLLGRWQSPDTLLEYSDLWGYAAPDGREYAILGTNIGTNFIEVTDPTHPRLVQSFSEQLSRTTWRDFKTYGHYAYGVADGSAHSLQIFDLSHLPNRVEMVYDSDSLCSTAHTCFIENGKLYLIQTTFPNAATGDLERADVIIASLANPVHPRKLNAFSVAPYDPLQMGAASHAAFVQRDTMCLSAARIGHVLMDVRDPMHPVTFATINQGSVPSSWPPVGSYFHSSWATSDWNLLVVEEEIPQGIPLKIFDLRDRQHPRFVNAVNSSPYATPHNPYIVQDRYLVSSCYQDGTHVWDLQDLWQVPHLGGYDTYLPPSYTGYDGNWGTYPFLPSGVILASDIQSGLFVLQPPYPVRGSTTPDPTPSVPTPTAEPQYGLWPNPARENVTLSLRHPSAELTVEILDMLGRRVRPAQQWTAPAGAITVPVAGLPPGQYWLRVTRTDDVPRLERLLID